MLDFSQVESPSVLEAVLANIGHDLRAPLSSVLMISEILQDELYGPLTGCQVQALQHLETSAWKVLRLIDDLIDLARIETAELAMEHELVSIDLKNVRCLPLHRLLYWQRKPRHTSLCAGKAEMPCPSGKTTTHPVRSPKHCRSAPATAMMRCWWQAAPT